MGVEYQIASSETSFLAVDDRNSTVANELDEAYMDCRGRRDDPTERGVLRAAARVVDLLLDVFLFFVETFGYVFERIESLLGFDFTDVAEIAASGISCRRTTLLGANHDL